jgi:hypothetical protein
MESLGSSKLFAQNYFADNMAFPLFILELQIKLSFISKFNPIRELDFFSFRDSGQSAGQLAADARQAWSRGGSGTWERSSSHNLSRL